MLLWKIFECTVQYTVTVTVVIEDLSWSLILLRLVFSSAPFIYENVRFYEDDLVSDTFKNDRPRRFFYLILSASVVAFEFFELKHLSLAFFLMAEGSELEWLKLT